MTLWQNQDHNGCTVSPSDCAPCSATNECQDAAPGRLTLPLQRMHTYHPNCPDSLNCLPDTDEKPNHILPVIVRSAILGSPKRRLTLREIYAAIEGKWPYYRNAQSGWKDSIRHNLSLNRLFVKVPRPGTEPGYGSYWTVDLSAPPGSKRPRKRGSYNRNAASGSRVAGYSGHPSGSKDMGAVIIPPFRLEDHKPLQNQPHSSHSGSDLEPEDDQAEDPQSEYENEGESSPSPDSSGGFGVPPILPRARPNETLNEIISRLMSQLTESQRQFSVASAFSLRVSEELEQAKEEASKAQAKLRAAREQLEEELVARVEVEKRLEEEEGLRKETEEQLNKLLQEGGPGVRLFEAVRSIQDISRRALG